MYFFPCLDKTARLFLFFALSNNVGIQIYAFDSLLINNLNFLLFYIYGLSKSLDAVIVL